MSAETATTEINAKEIPGAKDNLAQQLASNSSHLQQLMEQQYNLELSRSVALFFSCEGQGCANTLTRALFAKGTRVLDHEPAHDEASDRYRIRVGVKRSLRDTVGEDFTRDLVETAKSMNGTYDGWELLSEEAAEDTQKHEDPQAA